jgi:hypothetical protein
MKGGKTIKGTNQDIMPELMSPSWLIPILGSNIKSPIKATPHA